MFCPTSNLIYVAHTQPSILYEAVNGILPIWSRNDLGFIFSVKEISVRKDFKRAVDFL